MGCFACPVGLMELQQYLCFITAVHHPWVPMYNKSAYPFFGKWMAIFLLETDKLEIFLPQKPCPTHGILWMLFFFSLSKCITYGSGARYKHSTYRNIFFWVGKLQFVSVKTIGWIETESWWSWHLSASVVVKSAPCHNMRRRTWNVMITPKLSFCSHSDEIQTRVPRGP